MWNIRSCPTLYLIDDLGVIRQQFDGSTEEHALDAAVDGLVREAVERSGPSKTK